MPRNRDKVQCSHVTASGRRCRNWVVRGSEPAACRAHGGRRPGRSRVEAMARRPGSDAGGNEGQELSLAPAGDDEASLEQEMAAALMALRQMAMILAAEGRFSPRVEAELIWAGLGVSRNGGRGGHERLGIKDATPESGREESAARPDLVWPRWPPRDWLDSSAHHTRDARDVRREQDRELRSIAAAIAEAQDELAAERGLDR